MDSRNLADLRRMALVGDPDRIRLFGEAGGLTKTAGGSGPPPRAGRRVVPPGGSTASDIPDPWGGGPDEFGHVLDLLGAAAPVIAARLARLLETAG